MHDKSTLKGEKSLAKNIAIITMLLICYIVDTLVVYRHMFDVSVRSFYTRNYAYMGFFRLLLVGCHM